MTKIPIEIPKRSKCLQILDRLIAIYGADSTVESVIYAETESRKWTKYFRKLKEQRK